MISRSPFDEYMREVLGSPMPPDEQERRRALAANFASYLQGASLADHVILLSALMGELTTRGIQCAEPLGRAIARVESRMETGPRFLGQPITEAERERISRDGV